MSLLVNESVGDVGHLRNALDELNFDAGVDRAALLIFGGTRLRPTSALFFLVCTDPDGEWRFLSDPDDTGEWQLVGLDRLPLFSSSYLMAGD